MAAFNDPQKLADAIALARSFKAGRQPGDRKFDRSISPAKAVDYASSCNIYPFDPKKCRQGRIVERSKEYNASGFVQPSKRQYSGDALVKGWQIGQYRAEDAVFGKAVFDFLNREDPVTTPAATLKPIVQLPTCSQTTSYFTKPRSPDLADASTPLTPQSPIQEAKEDYTSSISSPQKDGDEQEADQLAEMLSSFSFKEDNCKEDTPGHILDRFLELLAKNFEITQDLDQEKRSCVMDSCATRAEAAEHDGNKQKAATNNSHRSNEVDRLISAIAKTVPAANRCERLSATTPAFTPSKPDSSNSAMENPSPKQIEVGDNDQLQEDPSFTGQFSKASDDCNTQPGQRQTTADARSFGLEMGKSAAADIWVMK
ncbi:hypothetical protein ED733_000455 [Metarhizium rileyi]|uniref:Uncharacterized protein n=1 Tax=Metarhizium rileyi (strain RCEF 4871) TaxID=1649241 RepID=A0A5C6G5D9_METRR|nr:hypothetical protein ED733_000455 [Metarhizium rileyi]